MPGPSDESALLSALRDGDRTAWTRLYDRYSVEVWRYVARLVGPDTAAVADVVQEVFLAAARSARSFDPQRGTAWSYLAGIAHRQAATWWREQSRQARIRELVESNGADIRRLLDTTESLDGLLLRRELIDLIRFVLAELPAECAALLVAKYIDEQSLEQMASEAGTTVEAVKSKLARARREFRTRFEHASREPASTRDR